MLIKESEVTDFFLAHPSGISFADHAGAEGNLPWPVDHLRGIGHHRALQMSHLSGVKCPKELPTAILETIILPELSIVPA